jgi:hypothetical protein
MARHFGGADADYPPAQAQHHGRMVGVRLSDGPIDVGRLAGSKVPRSGAGSPRKLVPRRILLRI